MADPQNVEEVQHIVLQKILDRLGNHLKSIKGSDLRFIFEFYDELIFGSQIAERLRMQKSYLKFRASYRTTGAISICGVQSSSPLVYYIDMAPNAFPEKQFSVELLLKIMVNQLIHLILLCWDLARNHPDYCSEGTLHQTIREKYFGPGFALKKGMAILDLEYPQNYPTPFTTYPGLFSYRENSCYLDSLLTLLLLTEPDYYRRGMLDSVISSKQYKNPKLLFRLKNTASQKEIKNKALQLRKTLLQIFSKMVDEKKNSTSNLIRKQLAFFYEDLQNLFYWNTYNAPAIYDLFTEVFPNLKITSIPVWIKKTNKPPRKVTRELTMFQFWDFLGSSSVGEVIDWDKINTPVLVFQNGGIPFTSYNSLESIFVDGKLYQMSRCFKEKILEGRYQMTGAIILHGTSPGQDGGVHYTSYLRGKGGQWYHYNDIGPSWKLLKEFPDEVFFETNGSKPEMYFYCRLLPPPLYLKITERYGRKTVILAEDRGCTDSQKSQILKLHPTKTKSSKTWLWVLWPYEAQKVCEHLRAISSEIKVKGPI